MNGNWIQPQGAVDDTPDWEHAFNESVLDEAQLSFMDNLLVPLFPGVPLSKFLIFISIYCSRTYFFWYFAYLYRVAHLPWDLGFFVPRPYR